MESKPFVSILMLTHNASKFVELAIRGVAASTANVDFELVVVDNGSDRRTRRLLSRLFGRGRIQRLAFLDHNSLFAAGNNYAAAIASRQTQYFLLLNSDIRVEDPEWLSHLLSVHKPGITSYGVVDGPTRVDGYCLLVDAELYRARALDEGHEWWWSVTKLQAQLLNDGHSVQGFREHSRYLHHFGGKSGDAFSTAAGMDVTREQVDEWFAGHVPHLLTLD